MARIAFLGLGAMGRRMAARLTPDHDVVVYNRTASRTAPLVAAGAAAAATPAEAATGADIVLAIVTDDDAARAVWLHPETGALSAMRPGAVAIESSTTTPAWVRTLGDAADEAGVRFLDAPVVGSTPQAEAGSLAWLIGGDAPVAAEVDPVLALMGAKRLHVGPRSHGAVFKLVINALFATQVAAIAELLQMAASQGLDPAGVAERLAGLPVTSPAAGGVMSLMIAADHAPRFPIDLVQKDLAYARASGAGPLIAAAADRYSRASANGHGAANLSAVHLDE